MRGALNSSFQFARRTQAPLVQLQVREGRRLRDAAAAHPFLGLPLRAGQAGGFGLWGAIPSAPLGSRVVRLGVDALNREVAPQAPEKFAVFVVLFSGPEVGRRRRKIQHLRHLQTPFRRGQE